MNSVILTDNCAALNWVLEGLAKGFLKLNEQKDLLENSSDLPLGVYYDKPTKQWFVDPDGITTLGPYKKEWTAKMVYSRWQRGNLNTRKLRK